MEETIRAYLEAFTSRDKVALVIKTGVLDQIARNWRIAKGLHQPRLGKAEAARWLNDL